MDQQKTEKMYIRLKRNTLNIKYKLKGLTLAHIRGSATRWAAGGIDKPTPPPSAIMPTRHKLLVSHYLLGEMKKLQSLINSFS